MILSAIISRLIRIYHRTLIPFKCHTTTEASVPGPTPNHSRERIASIESDILSPSEEPKLNPDVTVTSPKEDSGGTNWSHVGTTALNTLVFALRNVSHAPIPGIGIAAGAVLDSIEHGKAIPANSEGVKHLAERMNLLSTFVEKIDLDSSEEVESISRRLISELKALSADIDTASNEGSVAQFFNSVETSKSLAKHDQTIDSIMTDLSATISVDTNTRVKEALAKLNGRNTPLQRMDVSHANINTAMEIGDERGGNAGYKNMGSIDVNASESNIRTGGGHLFSENDSTVR